VKFTEFRKKANLQFSVDNDRYTIAKLKKTPKFSKETFAIIKDANEVTIITKEGTKTQHISEEKFFKLITFDTALPFELSGFLAHIATLLATENIPIFAISAYSTDHILVKETDLDKTVKALEKDNIKNNNTHSFPTT